MSSAVEIARPVNINRRFAGSVSAVVKLVATVKEFAVAGIYGRSDAYEAFLMAALIPALLTNLVSESMSQALVPTFVRVREEEGGEGAQRLLSNALVSTIAVLVVVAAVAAVSARMLFQVIASHFGPAKMYLTVHLFYALLPVMFLAGVASNCTAILNTTGKFGWPALAPIAGPALIIAIVPVMAARYGIWAIAYATVAGAAVYAIWLAVMMRGCGYHFSLRWFGLNESSVEVARQYVPILLSGVMASGGLLVDQTMAAMLPSGSVAALAYGGRFVSVALALLGGSVSSAVTPVFAEMAARRDWKGCRRSLRAWAWMSAGASALVACVLILAAHMLVRLTFQHGVFGVKDSAAVTRVLEMYAIQIPFFVCSRVFYRFLIAMRRTDLVLYCGIVNLILDVVLNLLLMRWMGVAGIALATSLWTVSTLVFLGYWSWRVLPAEETSMPIRVA
jgi:putative peptidoglycan lipid II flippase